MPGLARTAIPAALGGGALLFGDDAEAGILTPGVRGARNLISYKPLAGRGGGEFLSFGEEDRVIDRKIELLQQIMKGGAGAKTFQDFIHQKSNYDDWSRVVEIDDKGLRGDNYKHGVDAFLEYIVEKAPDLEEHVNKYAGQRFGSTHAKEMQRRRRAKNDPNLQYQGPDPRDRTIYLERATRSPGLLDEGLAFEPSINKQGKPNSNPHHAAVHPDAPEGYKFVHGATQKPKLQQVSKFGRKKAAGPVSFSAGAPALGQDHLEATMHNREQKLNEHMDNLGLTKDNMYDYGSLLPVKQNIVTGESSLAAPDVLRDVMRGILGLGMTPETGIYDPQNLLDTVL